MTAGFAGLKIDPKLPATDRELLAACAEGDCSSVERLLALAANPVASSQAPIKVAAAHGHLAIVERLLVRPRVDAAAEHSEAFRLAAASGHAAVAERLLRVPGVDPAAVKNEALRLAASHGHLSTLKLLLSCGMSVDPTAEDNEALRLAAARGRTAVVGELMAWRPDAAPAAGVEPEEAAADEASSAAPVGSAAALERRWVDPSAAKCEALRLAAAQVHADVVDLLLAPRAADAPRISACEAVDTAFSAALKGGHGRIALRLLQVSSAAMKGGSASASASGSDAPPDALPAEAPSPAYPLLDVVSVCGQAMRLAAASGLVEMLEVLFARVDPAVSAPAFDAAVQAAAAHGRVLALDFLLSRPAPLPPVDLSAAFVAGAASGNTDVTDLLHSDAAAAPLVRTPDVLHRACLAASSQGHLAMLKSLIPLFQYQLPPAGPGQRVDDGGAPTAAAAAADSRLTQQLPLDAMLEAAAGGGHLHAVEYLLQQGASAAGNEGAAIIAAAGQGRLPMVMRLLQEQDLTPAAISNALIAANRGRCVDTAQHLLAVETVQPSASRNAALAAACFLGSAPLVSALLAHPAFDGSPTELDDEPLRTATFGPSLGGASFKPDILLALLEHPALWRMAAAATDRTADRRRGVTLNLVTTLLSHGSAGRASSSSLSGAALRAAVQAPLTDAQWRLPGLRKLISPDAAALIRHGVWARCKAALMARAATLSASHARSHASGSPPATASLSEPE